MGETFGCYILDNPVTQSLYISDLNVIIRPRASYQKINRNKIKDLDSILNRIKKFGIHSVMKVRPIIVSGRVFSVRQEDIIDLLDYNFYMFYI